MLKPPRLAPELDLLLAAYAHAPRTAARDWRDISRHMGFERAGGECERCRGRMA